MKYNSAAEKTSGSVSLPEVCFFIHIFLIFTLRRILYKGIGLRRILYKGIGLRRIIYKGIGLRRIIYKGIGLRRILYKGIGLRRIRRPNQVWKSFFV